VKTLWELHNENSLRVIGLMSGTSLDGLDVCYTRIEKQDGEFGAAVLAFSSYAYPDDFRAMLHRTFSRTASDICRANFDITRYWTELIGRFLEEHQIAETEPDLIGSHGQSIWHIHGDSTLQIGEASVLTEAFGIPVVSDFRVRDVAAGGSGAPLVPMLDYLLFRKYNKTFLVLNIGGIANFTIIPAGCASIDGVFALDTGPGNMLIDAVVTIASDGKETFDRDGIRALKGRIREDVLQDLMRHPYIDAPFPKSTGREDFGLPFARELIRRHSIGQEELNDLIATVTRFTAQAIFANYHKFFANSHPLDEIIVSGGGADNPVLMAHLQELFYGVTLRRSDEYGIESAAKEAFAFAVLAALSVWGEAGNIPNVTGARRSVVLGKISL